MHETLKSVLIITGSESQYRKEKYYSMAVLEIIALIGGAITIIGAISAVSIKLASFSSERKLTILTKEKTTIEQQLIESIAQQKALTEVLSSIKAGRSESQILKNEIDSELKQLALMAMVPSSSILVPYPPSNNKRFCFLSISGPEADKLKNTLLDIYKGIAGSVFKSGEAFFVNKAKDDSRWNPNVDKRITFSTKTLLCLPLRYSNRIVGVVQFLNKENGFSENDIEVMRNAIGTLSYKVGSFTQKAENFEQLGLAANVDIEDGTVIFVDLSSSSSLLRSAHSIPKAEVINLINEYLEKLTLLGMKNGCIADKYMWDGFILSLNVCNKIPNHRREAMKIAFTMLEEFNDLKASWVRFELPVSSLFCRIALASGNITQVDMGPAQYRQKTIVGDPVVIVSGISSDAPRDRNLIMIDQSLYEDAIHLKYNIKKINMENMEKIKELTTAVYELT